MILLSLFMRILVEDPLISLYISVLLVSDYIPYVMYTVCDPRKGYATLIIVTCPSLNST